MGSFFSSRWRSRMAAVIAVTFLSAPAFAEDVNSALADADAQYKGGQLGEAYASYSAWLTKYGATAPAAKKNAVDARLKELTNKTGAVALTVNESGATITIDDKPAGTTPIAAPLRVTPGPHRLRVTKDGFLPFDQPVDVKAGATATVSATLAPSSSKGKLVVKEKSGKPVRITVDGVDMGEAPWTGEVDPGQHEIGARATGLVATPQKINVERGKTQDVELVASASSAAVKIATSDGKGLIYIDEKLVGEGSYVGEVPAGPHKVKITREGYDPFEEELIVKDKEPLARTVTLKLSGAITTNAVQDVERLEGVYGGFGLIGFLTPGGTGNSVQAQCDAKDQTPSLANCSAADGAGGGVGGFIGYHWDPVGMELYFAGHYDQRKMMNDWNAASTDPGIGPDPARIEDFKIRRAGGMALARVRVTLQGSKVRGALIAGAGVSYRLMYLERDTHAKDTSGARDVYVSDSAKSYVSPVIMVEPTIMWRLTRGTAVSLGLQLWFETPSSFLNGRENPRTDPERNHQLGLRGVSTPSYELASDVQFFIGPVLGMMFGP